MNFLLRSLNSKRPAYSYPSRLLGSGRKQLKLFYLSVGENTHTRICLAFYPFTDHLLVFIEM